MSAAWRFVAFAAFLIGRAEAQEAQVAKSEQATSFTTRVEMQVVSIPVRDALRLVPEWLDAKTAPKAFERVQEMLAQDQATLIGWPVLWMKSGGKETDVTRGLTETNEEVRYPTEGTPPMLWGAGFAGPNYDAYWGPVTPTSYETRNAGVSLDADATVLDPQGNRIQVTVVAQHVRLARFDTWRIQPSPLGGMGFMVQPMFRTSKVTSQFTVARDRPTLIGHFIISDPQPHAELFILRACAVALPADQTPNPPTSPKK